MQKCTMAIDANWWPSGGTWRRWGFDETTSSMRLEGSLPKRKFGWKTGQTNQSDRWLRPCSSGKTSGTQRDSWSNPEVTCGHHYCIDFCINIISSNSLVLSMNLSFDLKMTTSFSNIAHCLVLCLIMSFKHSLVFLLSSTCNFRLNFFSFACFNSFLTFLYLSLNFLIHSFSFLMHYFASLIFSLKSLFSILMFSRSSRTIYNSPSIRNSLVLNSRVIYSTNKISLKQLSS